MFKIRFQHWRTKNYQQKKELNVVTEKWEIETNVFEIEWKERSSILMKYRSVRTRTICFTLINTACVRNRNRTSYLRITMYVPAILRIRSLLWFVEMLCCWVKIKSPQDLYELIARVSVFLSNSCDD